jgi:HK97 family phage prohead protease
MQRSRQIKSFSSPISDVDVKKRIVTGYFASFGTKDKMGDIIVKGAFKKTISELGPYGTQEIAHLQDHDKNKAVGNIVILNEDDKGLYYESEIGEHNAGVDFLKMVEGKIIKFHSIGYSTIKEQYDSLSKSNILKELKLYEGSSLQFIPANVNTPFTGLKSATDALAYLENLEKFIRTTDCTDETIIQLENKLKSLTELMKPLEDTSKNQEADVDQIKNLLKTFGRNGH